MLHSSPRRVDVSPAKAIKSRHRIVFDSWRPTARTREKVTQLTGYLPNRGDNERKDGREGELGDDGFICSVRMSGGCVRHGRRRLF